MIRKKKGIKALALGLVIAIMSSSFAFADTSAIPMSLTIKEKAIDVSVTEKLSMSASAGKTVMEVGDITVTNNAAGNSLYLYSAAYGGDVSPWNLVSDSTNFKTMKKNQHKYSLTADGQDLLAGSKDYNAEIAAGGTYTVSLAGKTGLSTEAVTDQQAGSVILTVGLTDPNAVEIVSWAAGTDEEIVAMVAAADAGKINLSDYWHVGDTRTVHLSAMSATNVGETHAEQDVELVLMHAGGYELADGSTCNFVVGQKDCLNEAGYMNSTDTNTGSWEGSARRVWCNDEYKNAMPASLSPIFKQFKTITAETYNGTTLKTSLDYFALPAAKEIFGGDTATSAGSATSGSNLTEFNALFQFDWYKTADNRVKNPGNSSTDKAWWERSPYYTDDGRFCCVYNGPSMFAPIFHASSTEGLAPFGCI